MVQVSSKNAPRMHLNVRRQAFGLGHGDSQEAVAAVMGGPHPHQTHPQHHNDSGTYEAPAATARTAATTTNFIIVEEEGKICVFWFNVLG